MATHRVVSLIASATEIVTALGYGEHLVGRSHECDYPPSVESLPVCSSSKVDVAASSRAIDERVRRIAADGLSVYRVDPVLLDRLAPTVIVTQTQCEVCAVSLRDVKQAVGELVSSRPRIVSLEPMSLTDVWTDIRSVAEALGDVEGGERLVASLRARLDRVRQRVSGRPAPSIACIEWIDPLMAAANWVPELVEAAGGVNAVGEAGRHSTYMGLDELATADPDVIAFMPCGFDIERCLVELPALTARPGWRTLRAVQDGHVFVTDGNQFFNRPGPRIVESAEILAELLYPDVDFGHWGTGWRLLEAEVPHAT
jgi:iron complex transport system substrate-binding protein